MNFDHKKIDLLCFVNVCPFSKTLISHLSLSGVGWYLGKVLCLMGKWKMVMNFVGYGRLQS